MMKNKIIKIIKTTILSVLTVGLLLFVLYVTIVTDYRHENRYVTVTVTGKNDNNRTTYAKDPENDKIITLTSDRIYCVTEKLDTIEMIKIKVYNIYGNQIDTYWEYRNDLPGYGIDYHKKF